MHNLRFIEQNQNHMFMWQTAYCEEKGLLRGAPHVEFSRVRWEPMDEKPSVLDSLLIPIITDITVEISDEEYDLFIKGYVPRNVLRRINKITGLSPEKRLYSSDYSKVEV